MSQGTVTGGRMVGVARWAARLSAAALVLFWVCSFSNTSPGSPTRSNSRRFGCSCWWGFTSSCWWGS